MTGARHDVLVRDDGAALVARSDPANRLPEALLVAGGVLRAVVMGQAADAGVLTREAIAALERVKAVPVILMGPGAVVLGGAMVPVISA